MKKSAIVFLMVLVFTATTGAQSVKVPFDSDAWDLSNAEYSMQDFEGKQSLLLQSGFLFIKDLEFLNGTIELDINFSGLRNFPGVGFRMYSPGNFEEFYIRPHQSGNPDANQYTPVFNGLAGWQLYHGEQYATAIPYTFNQWHHLKIVVKGNQAWIYYDDMEKPLLVVDELKQETKAGTLGLRTRANVHFANFEYTLDPNTYPEAPVENNHADGQITSWELSQIQSDESFQEKFQLSNSDLKDIQWSSRPVESSGLLNIAKYLKLEDGQATAVARLRIESNAKQIKKLDFGYSDLAQVYVNNQLLYSGGNTFMSRDYRYLGTIGYFDSVYLPLKKGSNEVLLVVKENFGGWGVQAIMKDREGVVINP